MTLLRESDMKQKRLEPQDWERELLRQCDKTLMWVFGAPMLITLVIIAIGFATGELWIE